MSILINNMFRKIINTIHLLPIYWAVSGLFIVNNGDKILVSLILASLITKLLSHFLRKEKILINFNLLIFSIFAVSIYASIKYFYNGYSSSEIRVLISTLLYATLSLPKKIKHETLIYTITISSIFILSQTINILELQGLTRKQLPLNAIPYANFTGLLSIISLYLAYINKNKLLVSLSILSFILLTINVILVDTRGTWLALIAVYITIIFLVFLKNKNWKVTLIFLSLFTTIAASSYPIIENRIDRSIHEVELLTEGNLNSSWGIRLQLWMVGYDIIKNNPSLVGLGQTAHIKIIQDMYERGEVKKSLAKFDNKNFHNSIIDRTVKYGFLGLALYLSIILIPFFYGINNLSSSSSPLLVIMPIFLFSAGLTYIPLSHPGTYFLYLFTSIICINKIKAEK
ncbi:O-antigen ligase family protein [Vibrio sp. 10N.261.51.A3]|uniref:O-antigen ligase family protein n=1 Tax=Vibrio sp. 10N.261.51.A3 TaxID=3229673 RepID=UPI00354ED090